MNRESVLINLDDRPLAWLAGAQAARLQRHVLAPGNSLGVNPGAPRIDGHGDRLCLVIGGQPGQPLLASGFSWVTCHLPGVRWPAGSPGYIDGIVTITARGRGYARTNLGGLAARLEESGIHYIQSTPAPTKCRYTEPSQALHADTIGVFAVTGEDGETVSVQMRDLRAGIRSTEEPASARWRWAWPRSACLPASGPGCGVDMRIEMGRRAGCRWTWTSPMAGPRLPGSGALPTLVHTGETAVPLTRARSTPARRRSRPRPARRSGGPGPARYSRAGAAAHPARQRVLDPEPFADQLADLGQRPALIGPAPSGRVGGQHCLRLAQLGPACTGPRRRPWRPAPASRRWPAPAATGSPTSATSGTAGPPPGRWCRPRSAPPRPAAPVRGGPVLRRSARRHRGSSWFRHSALRRPSPEPVPPQLKIFFRR
jgi:hypothetical protein